MRILSVDGHLKSDAEIRTAKTGAGNRTYLFFELANKTYIKGRYETTWYTVISFDESLKNRVGGFKKGAYVFVSGAYEVQAVAKDKIYLNQTIIANSVELLFNLKASSGDKQGNSGSINIEADFYNNTVNVPPPNPTPVSSAVQTAIVPNKLTKNNSRPIMDPMLNMPDADVPSVVLDDDGLPF